jgi:hypothetical protein
MIPNDDETYVVYMIMGEGHEHAVELATEATVRDTPYWWPSESWWLVPNGERQSD